ncbi:MAG: Scr1 family TA system antitoxin-like transcriptional regulator, partial [Sciscionella sp.]
MSEQEITERVAARMRRQWLLKRGGGFRLHVLLHEAALRQQVGGREVVTEQLAHLAEVAEMPAVTLQVVPSGSVPTPAWA